MANNRVYKCSNCGHTESKWFGRCVKCGEYNTAEEGVNTAKSASGAAVKTSARAARAASGDSPERVTKVSNERFIRIKTGISEFDRVLGGGFVPGGVTLLAGKPGAGKALALDTPLVTPSGWTTMGQVKVGDELIGRNGQQTKIVAVTEIMDNRPCYKIEFSDGATIIADAEHQWITSTRIERAAHRRPNQPAEKVRTTQEIYETLLVGRNSKETRLNHSIAIAESLVLEEKDLLIPPYTLGAWLGDGHSSSARLTCFDTEIVDNIRAEGIEINETEYSRGRGIYKLQLVKQPVDFSVNNCSACGTPILPEKNKYSIRRSSNFCYEHRFYNTLKDRLRRIEVVDKKHIPQVYLRASREQRLALLAGLLDTDGYISARGGIELSLTSKRLSYDAYELILGLGYKATVTTKRVKGRTEESSTAYRIKLTTSDNLFRLARKGNRTLPVSRTTQTQRYITNVTPIDSVPVRCVQVDNEDHTYLAGETMIPTHNSTLILEVAKALTDQGKTALIISGEETKSQIASRAKRVGALSDNLYLMSESNLSNAMAHMENLQPDFFVVDSLQALASDSSESRIGSIAQSTEVAHEATQMAKSMGIPAMLIGQINKSDEIAGSMQISHLVDTVMFLESSDESALRLLRTTKNRYGELEVGCFEHTEDGLVEVADPSGFFLDGHAEDAVGYATSILIEGNRALPIEIQALVTSTALPNPRKISNGLDHGRVMMIQAILEKHGHLRLGDKDLYVSTTGGLLTKDSSIDLAIAAAIISSYKNVALPDQSVFLGETSLTGEIRSPRSARKRAGEARRLGFKNVVMPVTKDETAGRNTVVNIKELLAKIGNRVTLPDIDEEVEYIAE